MRRGSAAPRPPLGSSGLAAYLTSGVAIVPSSGASNYGVGSLMVEIAAVVIVLHGDKFPLGRGEASTLDSFLNVPGLGVGRLRGPLRAASEGDEINITEDAERDALQAAL